MVKEESDPHIVEAEGSWKCILGEAREDNSELEGNGEGTSSSSRILSRRGAQGGSEATLLTSLAS